MSGDRNESDVLPRVTRYPSFLTSTLIPGAGVLTRAADLSGEPSALVRNACASCAFAPRRVASSETARKAVRRSAAEPATRTGVRSLRMAWLSAFAERVPGRRSGKLAIVVLHPCAYRTRLQSFQSALYAPGVSFSGVQTGGNLHESPFRVAETCCFLLPSRSQPKTPSVSR